jgi:hypothetical protein
VSDCNCGTITITIRAGESEFPHERFAEIVRAEVARAVANSHRRQQLK